MAGRPFAVVFLMIALTNLSQYLVEGAAADLRRRAAGPEVKKKRARTSRLAAVLYVTSAILARPRQIDHYIDYFGAPVTQAR